MIGNRVRVIREAPEGSVDGILHKLDPAGVRLYRESSLPEGRGMVFIPMQRIVEIVDLGRAP
jgi:hypothetical protein